MSNQSNRNPSSSGTAKNDTSTTVKVSNGETLAPNANSRRWRVGVGAMGAVALAVIAVLAMPPATTTGAAAAVNEISHPVVAGKVKDAHALIYDVTFTLDEAVNAFGDRGGAFDAHTHFAGVLRFDPLVTNLPSTSSHRMRVSALDAFDVQVNGMDIVDDDARAAFTTSSIVVDADAHGTPLTISPEPGTHELFMRMSQLLLSAAQVRREPGDHWSTTERVPDGERQANYHVVSRENGQRRVEKESVPLTTRTPDIDLKATPATVEGTHVIVLSIDDVVHAIDANTKETITNAGGDERSVRRLRMTWRLQTTVPVARAVRPMTVTSHPADALLRNEARAAEQTMRARIAGLTVDDIASALPHARVGGMVPDHKQFLWRATALMRIEENALVPVVSFFNEPTTTTAGRAFALDLLANAGSPAAQRALIALLDSPITADDKRALELYQRLTFVRHPTKETVAFVTSKLDVDGAWKTASRMSAGSFASYLAGRDRIDEGEALVDALTERLDGASTDERIVIVKALGNAAYPHRSNPILAAASSVNEGERMAAAGALRHVRTTEGRRMLLKLGRDPSAAVANRAFISLQKNGAPNDDELVMLADDVAAARVDDLALMSLVGLVAPLVDTPRGRAVLEAVVARENVRDPSIKNRVRVILSNNPVQ